MQLWKKLAFPVLALSLWLAQPVKAQSICGGPSTALVPAVADMIAYNQYARFPHGVLYDQDRGRPWQVNEVRYPFPDTAVLLVSIDERTGTGKFLAWKGCFPIPWPQAFEHSPHPFVPAPLPEPIYIGKPLTGPVDVASLRGTLLDPNAPDSNAPDSQGASNKNEDEADRNQQQEEREKPTKDKKPEKPQSTGSCGTYRGVSQGAFATAISGIEGGYTSASGYLPKNGTQAIGRYQFLANRSDVKATISKNPGGAQFLQRVNSGQLSKREVERQLPTYFPPEQQDALFKQVSRDEFDTASRQTDPTTGQKFEGDRLVERAAQIHFGGPSARRIDSGISDKFGRLSIYTYGVTARKNYNRALSNQSCSKSTN
jgi:hypothetical protein